MKKLFTILCAAVLSLGVSAQTESGNMLVSATSNLSYVSGDAGSMSLGVGAGYFVMDNFAVLAGLNYSKSEGQDEATTIIGIGGRYYMGSMYGGLLYVIGPDYGFASYTGLDLNVGYNHMLTDNISLEPSLHYGMGMGDFSEADAVISLNVGFGLYF